VEQVVEAMVVFLQDTLDVQLFQVENVELLIQVEAVVEVLLQVAQPVEKAVQELYLQKN
jgi:hypothetical protein